MGAIDTQPETERSASLRSRHGGRSANLAEKARALVRIPDKLRLIPAVAQRLSRPRVRGSPARPRPSRERQGAKECGAETVRPARPVPEDYRRARADVRRTPRILLLACRLPPDSNRTGPGGHLPSRRPEKPGDERQDRAWFAARSSLPRGRYSLSGFGRIIILCLHDPVDPRRHGGGSERF